MHKPDDFLAASVQMFLRRATLGEAATAPWPARLERLREPGLQKFA
jgi:hypothetical protein